MFYTLDYQKETFQSFIINYDVLQRFLVKSIYHIKYLPPAISDGLVSGVAIQVVSPAKNVGHIWNSTVSPSAIQLTKAY